MKIVTASAIALLLASSAAYAADAVVSEPTPPVAPDTFSWTGGYIGVNAGYAGGSFKYNASEERIGDIASAKITSSGFVGGVQVGYNWQFDNRMVIGAEADFQGSTLKGEVSGDIDGIGGLSAGSKVQWFGTVRARVGYSPVDRFLVYGTAGLAYGKVKSYYDLDGSGDSLSKTKAGWTVGAGVEYALTNNWTVKTEYLFTDLGKQTLYDEGGLSLDNKVRFHTVRVGLNYKF